MQKAKDRYVTFENIDCYQNARDVLDAMAELFALHVRAKNSFWEKFYEQIPQNYQEELARMDCKDILYQVCSNVFYISDLFEEYAFEKGMKLLEIAELECC